jgi:hypothetical protein
MKKILYNSICSFALFGAVTASLLLSSCDDEKEVGIPAVSEVRNYAAAPDDTLITTLNTGQWVVLLGQNLQDVTQVFFGSTAASINRTFLTDRSVVVQVPEIPFQSVPRDRVNIVTVVNSNGNSTTFEIQIVGAPIITHIRNYADAPDDQIVDMIFPDQAINLVGYNLKEATSIAFQGVEADLSNVVFTDTSAIVRVPADLSKADVTLANTITYTTPIGEAEFKIRIIGPPLITNISCENPSEGSTVMLSGYNFIAVETLKFGGTTISTFQESADGSSVEFVVPALTGGGPVVITTPAGTYSTIFNVNDVSTNVLCNFDDISPIGWGGSAAMVSDDPSTFPGNRGKYAILQNDILAPWDWKAWDGGRIMLLNPVQWIAGDTLADPLNKWVVKFEMNVPEDWNGTTLFISSETNDFKAFYEPWKDATGKTSSYRTDGWRTVTVPLAKFYKGWGGTVAPKTLKELIGASAQSGFAFQTMNISNNTTPKGLKSAIDNIRVVRIK